MPSPSQPSTSVRYRPPTTADVAALRFMARTAFSDTFAHLYPPDPFRDFLDCSYGVGGTMDSDLGDNTVQFMLAVDGSEVAGYAKLTPLRAPAPAAAPRAVELQQLYISREWQGTGVAPHLMEWALGTAAAAGATEIYLTVFDHNTRAKRFYTRYGFVEVGRCTFTLGDRVDDDRIWMRGV